MDSKYNTLIITEGEQYEKRFFTNLLKFIAQNKNTLIFPFKNNIHKLYDELKNMEFNSTTISVLLHCFDLDEETKEILTNNKFVNIYLVFDLDLQDKPESEYENLLNNIEEMLNRFSDETGDYGKLFVNYPMMESFRHYDFSNPITLKDKFAITTKQYLNNYKCIVGKEGTNKSINSLQDYCKICNAHLKKANYICNNKFTKPSLEQYNESIINIGNIHQKQCSLIKTKKQMHVLNTSIFLYAEYYPNILKRQNDDC